jgi:DNA-binding transcriptional regulator YiaG
MIPLATLKVEVAAVLPPKPLGGGVFVDGRCIAVLTTSDIQAAADQIVGMETARMGPVRTMMQGAEVKRIREEIGHAVGRRLSQRDLGLALGLSPANAADMVRSWEDGSKPVSGPAATALNLMAMAFDPIPQATLGEAFLTAENAESGFRAIMRAELLRMFGS